MHIQTCGGHQFFLELCAFFRLLSEGLIFQSTQWQKTSQAYFTAKQRHSTNFTKAEKFQITTINNHLEGGSGGLLHGITLSQHLL